MAMMVIGGEMWKGRGRAIKRGVMANETALRLGGVRARLMVIWVVCGQSGNAPLATSCIRLHDLM